MEATCNCGAITVKITDDELFTKKRGHLCYCENCRKTAGSVFSANLIIENSKISITGEENLSVYEDKKTTSGNPVYRYFCKTCGNPIKSMNSINDAQSKTILKMGIFEKLPEPEMENFVRSRQSWLHPVDGTVQWKGKVGGEKV